MVYHTSRNDQVKAVRSIQLGYIALPQAQILKPVRSYKLLSYIQRSG
jgi:hypothetical protein